LTRLKLVVVESPAKAKTIEKYLGPGHRVLASYGHVRDLPPKDGSVKPDEGFAMDWETYPDKARQLKAITDETPTARGRRSAGTCRKCFGRRRHCQRTSNASPSTPSPSLR
jgi:hypothetical protein